MAHIPVDFPLNFAKRTQTDGIFFKPLNFKRYEAKTKQWIARGNKKGPKRPRRLGPVCLRLHQVLYGMANGAEGAAGAAAENPLPVHRDERGRERRADGRPHANPFQKSGRLHPVTSLGCSAAHFSMAKICEDNSGNACQTAARDQIALCRADAAVSRR
jgi:hypothetical protein